MDKIVVMAVNVGGASTDGGPVTIGDTLPAGLIATEVQANQGDVGITGLDSYRKPFAGWPSGKPSNMQCTGVSAPVLSCTESNPVDPGDTLILTIPVSVTSTPSAANLATVSGGGAAAASVESPIIISSSAAAYGVAAGGAIAASSTSQAGGHPNVTTSFFLNTVDPEEGPAEVVPAGDPKDVGFDLPPGLVGSTVGMPRCTMADVADEAKCPRDTIVGSSTIIFYNAPLGGREEATVPVFNIAPAPGEPAAFAFDALIFPVRLDTSVLSGGDYGVRVTAPDISQGGDTLASSITIWGVPADHNGPGPDSAIVSGTGTEENEYGTLETEGWRTFGGTGEEELSNGGNGKLPVTSRVALLSNPSQCTSPLAGLLETDSWEGLGPGVFAPPTAVAMGMITGCGQLSFEPSVSMLPDTLAAGAPAGYSFDLSVPQDTDPDSVATPDVKRTSVTLPLGTVISPSAANGLGDCTSEEFGLHSGVPGVCPRDSQVGTARVKTPALEERLNGEVFLAAPQCTGAGGACTPLDAAEGRMIHLYVQLVGEGEDGIVVKLEGTGRLDQRTGQLTTTFEETPQLPFGEFQLTLQGGERATLANPRTCGEATTSAELTPWSTPFTPDATPTSTFDVRENCFASQFDPSFVAHTTSDRAGEFAPFTMSFGRSDSDEFLNGIQIGLPPGLLGMLSRVSLCGEAQANAGTCGPESEIGEASVETGPGGDPILVTGGRVYITGPYRGAPYGLSIVVPAVAGPYTLSGTTGEGTVVVRSAIAVNPETAALTVTSDPLPTELDGIPLQLRAVGVTIDRPEFTFNPTTCNQLTIAATLSSAEGASANESSPVAQTNCAALKFQPKLTASTSAKTSRTRGASLDVKVAYPATPQGTEANIAKVKVDLPKRLVSRLTTLQKACAAAVFDADPANCPAASAVGVARVQTPVLPGAGGNLSGPAYFVSHGGEAFPSLTIVLQGDGVRVDLTGATFIDKARITSTTFNTLPDVPFSSFELSLPTGRYSALTANGNLCNSKPTMPTVLVAQNGAEIHQSTKIAVTGCPRAGKAAGRKKAGKGRKRRRV